MQQFVGTSLKTRLYLLLLAAFIPVTLLVFYMAEEQKALETAAILQKTMLMVRAAANEENQQLESTGNTLTTVVDSFLMVEGHVERLTDMLADLVQPSKGYAEVGIVDRTGHLLAGSDPSTLGKDYRQKSWFAAGLKSKGLVLGPYHDEHINGRPVIYLVRSIPDKRDTIAAVAFAALNLDWINRSIFKLLAELPKSSRLTLLDQKHSQGMLRYDADTGRWEVPFDFNPTVKAQITRHASGTLSAADENGVLKIYAFTPLTSTFRNRRFCVVLEIPQALALADSQRIFSRNLLLLVASALIAMLAIWWVGDRLILKRVREMVRATRQLAAGRLNVRVGPIGGRDELSHLAGVFDEMADALQIRIAREQEIKTSLAKSRDQLRRLSAYQQEIREQERIRIAREIHDQLGQSLTILKMDLVWLNKHLDGAETSTRRKKMDAMADVIAAALESLHQVIAELRPIILDDFGLAAAIAWQAAEFSNRFSIACRIKPTGYEPDLPKDQATALFRVFQELLTNIVRHAQAGVVDVCLERRDGHLVLEVSDNGRGITEGEINDPKSYGLLGIRERLYPWNGRVSFDGRPGKGTRVTIVLPLPGKDPIND